MSGHGRILAGQFAFRSPLEAIRCVEKQQGVPAAERLDVVATGPGPRVFLSRLEPGPGPDIRTYPGVLAAAVQALLTQLRAQLPPGDVVSTGTLPPVERG